MNTGEQACASWGTRGRGRTVICTPWTQRAWLQVLSAQSSSELSVLEHSDSEQPPVQVIEQPQVHSRLFRATLQSQADRGGNLINILIHSTERHNVWVGWYQPEAKPVCTQSKRKHRWRNAGMLVTAAQNARAQKTEVHNDRLVSTVT